MNFGEKYVLYHFILPNFVLEKCELLILEKHFCSVRIFHKNHLVYFVSHIHVTIWKKLLLLKKIIIIRWLQIINLTFCTYFLPLFQIWRLETCFWKIKWNGCFKFHQKKNNNFVLFISYQCLKYLWLYFNHLFILYTLLKNLFSLKKLIHILFIFFLFSFLFQINIWIFLFFKPDYLT